MKNILLGVATLLAALLVTTETEARGRPPGRSPRVGRGPRVGPRSPRAAPRFTYRYWDPTYRCYVFWSPARAGWYYFYPATRTYLPYAQIASFPPTLGVNPRLPRRLPAARAKKPLSPLPGKLPAAPIKAKKATPPATPATPDDPGDSGSETA
jgi:hypothetical protein